MLFDHRVICTIDKKICARLVFYNTEFAFYIILKTIVIPVKMIFGNIGQDGYVRTEFTNIIQLKTADFRDVPFFWILRNLPGNGISDVSNQGTIQTSVP